MDSSYDDGVMTAIEIDLCEHMGSVIERLIEHPASRGRKIEHFFGTFHLSSAHVG